MAIHCRAVKNSLPGTTGTPFLCWYLAYGLLNKRTFKNFTDTLQYFPKLMCCFPGLVSPVTRKVRLYELSQASGGPAKQTRMWELQRAERAVLRIRIQNRNRIRMFLGLPDPDLLVKRSGPAPWIPNTGKEYLIANSHKFINDTYASNISFSSLVY